MRAALNASRLFPDSDAGGSPHRGKDPVPAGGLPNHPGAGHRHQPARQQGTQHPCGQDRQDHLQMPVQELARGRSAKPAHCEDCRFAALVALTAQRGNRDDKKHSCRVSTASVLARFGGRVGSAAQALGISRKTLWEKKQAPRTGRKRVTALSPRLSDRYRYRRARQAGAHRLH